MGIHKPRRMEVWVSPDDRQYRKIKEQSFTETEIFRQGMFTEDVQFDLKDESRYVRIVAYGAWYESANACSSGANNEGVHR